MAFTGLFFFCHWSYVAKVHLGDYRFVHRGSGNKFCDMAMVITSHNIPIDIIFIYVISPYIANDFTIESHSDGMTVNVVSVVLQYHSLAD